MKDPLKILIVEDNLSDADLLCRALKKSGLICDFKIVQTRQTYEQALEIFKPDLILSDYSLPSFDAVTAFKIKQEHHALVPFIIISGVIGEENAVELIKSGVTDYVSKEKLFSRNYRNRNRRFFSRSLSALQGRKVVRFRTIQGIEKPARMLTSA